jgi:peptide/nickel transport system substrate-binding protein
MKRKYVNVVAVTLMTACFMALTGCGSTGQTGDVSVSNGSEAAASAISESGSGSATTQAETAAATASNGKLKKVAAVVNSLDSLDPFGAMGNATRDFLLYEPLWTQNEKNDDTVGVIAKDWKIDGNAVDVTIYDYVTDSAGNHITASDVVFSYKKFMDSGEYLSRYVTSIEATGDYSCHIEFSTKPYPTFLSTVRVPIISEAAYTASDADFVNHPIGTGHYVVSEFVAANKAVFTKRNDHWQSSKNEDLVPYNYKANVDVVELDCILETPQIQNGLETGTLQCGPVTAMIAEGFAGNDKLKVTKIPGKYCHTIMLNCYQGVFKDNPTLRKAVLYAIDTSAIAQSATDGTGHMSYTLGDESLTGYDSAWESEDYYNFNLDKAKELMAEAGYPNGGLTLKWLGKTEEQVELTSQVIQAQLAQIGITLEISNLDNTTYMAQRPATSGDWNLAWGDSVPRGNLMNSFVSYCDNTPYSGYNQEGIADDKMQELMNTALYDQSKENINALHDYVKESASIVGSYVDYDFWGHDSRITIVTGNDGEIAVNAFQLSDDYDVYAE